MPIKKTRPNPKKVQVRGIVQDGPGRFLARVDWRDERTGRRRTKRKVCRSLEEAVAFQEKRGAAERESTTRPHFAEFAEQWVRMNHSRFEPSSRVYYASNVARAVEAFGHLYVDAIIPSDIRNWIAGGVGQYAPATLNGWLRVVRQILDDVVADGLLPGNPARAVKALPEKRTEGPRGNSLTLEEFRRFIDTVPKSGLSPDVARLLLVAAWTGCRRGELLALKWSDHADGELRIERSVWHRVVKATKSNDPRRVVVVEPLKKVLEEQRRWLIKEQHPALPTGLMFPASPRQARVGAKRRGVEEVSWYRGMNALYRPLRKVVKAAGITLITPHSLRRTWENLLRSAGVDVLVRRAMAGWRTETAQRIYATVEKAEREAAAGALVRHVLGEAG